MPTCPAAAQARPTSPPHAQGNARRRATWRRRPRLSRLLAWLLSAWLGGAGLAQAQLAPGALPTGGQVIVGSGQLQQSANLLVIQQNTARLGLDWQSFNIGSGATVEFRQPGANAIALNRVLGNSGTQIYGQLKANGQVFLTNPNGVLFAPGARVDVGGLVASTLDLSQQDFAEGRFNFTAVAGGNGNGNGNGQVVNQGQLRAQAGGYLALFGNQVDNSGSIAVDAGQVVLASGRAATVSISGSGLLSAVITPSTQGGSVLNSGSIAADGGVITLSAKSAQDIAASLVNNSGVIRANTLVERGGEIWITGDNVVNSGSVSAAAPAGGHGGDGGRILLLGSQQNGSVQLAGTLDASAAGGGQGGFIETSAAHVRVADTARVSTAAGARTGTWLIDPVDFTIAASGGDITGAVLSGQLNNNAVTIQSSLGSSGTLGNVNVNDAVSWSANRLTLNASNNVVVNAPLNGSGTASLALEVGQGAVAAGNSSGTQVNAPISLPQGNSFSTRLGSNGTVIGYTVVNTLAGLQALDGNAAMLAGNYALGADIDASSTAAGAGFNPIGNETSYSGAAGQAFTGRFDGLGHSITALTVNRPASNYSGLFATASGASISNLTLVGGAISGSQYVGGIVGYADNNTALTKVRSAATVAAVDDSTSGVYAGGLVGFLVGSVRDSVATGAVSGDSNSGTAYLGGAVGLQAGTGSFINVSASGSVTATVRGSGNGSYYTGGLLGYSVAGSLTGVSASGNVSGGATSGGLAGLYDGGASISGATASGNVSGSVNVGGLFGRAAGAGSITASTATGNVSSTSTSGNVGGLVGSATIAGGLSGVTATGTVSGGSYTGGLVGNYASNGNIANTRAEGAVSGSFDVGGLIGYASGTGKLSDGVALGAVSASINNGYVGGLAGFFAMSGGLERGDAAGTVTGGDKTGGLVGWYSSTAALSASLAHGTSVSGVSYVGGLVGYSDSSSISGSRATANVTASGGYAGGLVGRSGGSISGASGVVTASGSVSGTGSVGGVVGTADGTGDLTDLSATGSVSGVSNSGNVGGMAGNITSGSVIRGTASGTVTGGYLTGGLIGNLERNGASISASSASGNVTGGTNVGGLVGRVVNTGTGVMTGSSATGNVVATTHDGSVGGLAGVFTMAQGMSNTSAAGTVAGGANAGGLVGYFGIAAPLSGGTATGASVSDSTSNAGGLVGLSLATSITGSTARADVSSSGNAGGLVGNGNGNVTGQSGTVTASGNVTGGTSSGGLVGYQSAGTLTAVSATGAVTGTSYTGGLLGYFNGSGSLSYATASGAVSGTSYAGGLVGYFTATGGLSHATASGAVSGADNAGGLVGFYQSGGNISDSTASGRVTGTSYAGGLIGRWYYSGGSITDTRATGDVTSGYMTGGLVGYGQSGGGIVNSSASGRVTGTAYAGGLVGYLAETNISGSEASGSVIAAGNSTVYAGGLVGSFSNSQTGGQISNSSASGNVFADGSGAFAGGLVGSMGAGAIAASASTPATSGNVVATDSASSNSASSNHYAGGLVGNFSGLSITGGKATGDVAGRYYTGGLVGNYGGTAALSGSSASGAVTGTQYVGGLVGQYAGSTTLTTSSASGNVVGSQYVGGLVGSLQYAGVSGSSATGNVTGTAASSYAGGLVGFSQPYYASSVVSTSSASGNVSGGTAAGGLVGFMQQYYYNNSATNVGIANSRATGNVAATTYAGGLVGYYDGYNGYSTSDQGISSSQASGNVQSAQYAGGLAGYFRGYGGIQDSAATGNVTGTSGSSLHALGGLVGYFINYSATNNTGTLTRSWASGNVSLPGSATLTSTTDAYLGGLVGYVDGYTAANVTITDAYASGAVSAATTAGRPRVGGLVGTTDTSIARTYATGAVSASGGSSRAVGGLVAERVGSTATATSSYWATDATGQSGSVIGTARTLAQLKNAATFAGWDVASAGGSSSVWRIYEGYTGPLLRSFLTPLTGTLANVTRAYDGSTSLAGAVLAGATNPERIFVGGITANVGSYAFTPANLYSVQNGYDLNLAGSGNLTVSRRQLTLAGLAANKVYDATLAATLNATAQPGNLVAGEDLVFQAGSDFAMQFADKTAGTGKTVNLVGSYTYVDGTRGKAGNYILPTGTTTTADISKATLTAGSFNATSRAYDGTTVVAVAATTTTLSGVKGSDSVSVDLSGITSGTMADKNVGTGKLVAVSGASLSGSDASNYVLAGLDAVRVNITPKTITANGITATNRQYNAGTNVSLDATAAALSGVVAGDQLVANTSTISGTVANKNAADGKAVTITGLGLRGQDAGNYAVQQGTLTVNITKAPLTAYLARTSQTDKVYDGTTTAAVQLYSYNTYGGDTVNLSATSIGYDNKNVLLDSSGNVTYKTISGTGVSIAGADAANYTLQSTTASSTYGYISPKPLAVNGITTTNRVYDGTRNVTVNVGSASVNSAGVVANDNVAVSIPGSGTVTGQLADKNVGTGKTVTVPGLTLTGSDAGNYTLSSTGLLVNITQKALTATYTGVDRVYDGTVRAVTVASTTDIVSGDTVTFSSNDYNNYYNTYYPGYNYTWPSATFIGTGAKNVGNNKDIRITSDGLAGTDAGNYRLTNASNGNGVYGTTASSITPKPVTLAFSGITKVYDGSTVANVSLNYGGSAGVVSGDTLTTTQTAAYTGSNAKNAGTGKAISVSNIVLGGADASNYTVANTTAAATGTITAKPVTLTGISAISRAYDGTNIVGINASNITSSGFLGGDTVAVSAGNLTSGTVASKNVGNNKPVTVTGLGLTGADAANYSIDLTGSGITANITPKVLTPVYIGGSRVYDGSTTAPVAFDMSAIYSGDTISFSQQAVFTGTGARNAGTGKAISVTGISLYDYYGYGNYTLASTTASTTGTITPKPVTASYAGLSRVYDGVADTSASVLGSSLQLLLNDDVGFTQTARFTGDGSAGTGKAVAVSNIALTGADRGNYSLASTTATTVADITRRNLALTGITANNRVYDGSTSVQVNLNGAAVDTSSVIAGDVVSVVVPTNGVSTGTIADRHVGTGKAVAITGLAISGSSAANYQLVGATGLSVNITPAQLTANYAGVSRVYDGTATAQVLATPANLYAIDAGMVFVSAQGTFSAGKNVGTGLAVAVSGGFLSGSGRDDYVLANSTGSTSAGITPKGLTAGYTAGQTKVYDGSTAAPVSGRLFGLVSGDVVSLGQTAVFSDSRNVGSNKPIAVSALSLGGADRANYTLSTTSASTSGSVTAKAITVSGLSNVLAIDRVYNGSSTVAVQVPSGVTLVPQSSDIVSGDQVSIAVPTSGFTTGSMLNKNVGSAKLVNVDGLSLAGADGANYSIAGTAGITVNITPRQVTAVYAGVNRVYDGGVAATATGTSGDFLSGDLVSIVGSGVFTGTGARNVGTGKAVSVQAASLQNNNGGNNDAANYALVNSSGSTTADITPKTVTASYAGASKVYDGLTTAPVSGSAGFVAGDAVGLLQTAVFSGSGAKNVGTGKGISVSAIQLSGNDAGNYRLLNSTAATTGSITPKGLRIDGLTGVTAEDRVYNGSTLVSVLVSTSGTLTPNAMDLIAGDVVSISAPASGRTTGTLLDKNAGSGKAVAVNGLSLGGADGANYSITSTSGVTVNIATKGLTAVYSGVSRVYDGSVLASVSGVGSAGDIVVGDSVSISGSGVFTGNGAKNVGVGKQIDFSGASLAGTDARNYSLLNPSGSTTASITPKSVSVSYTGGSKVYDGTASAVVNGQVNGLVANDSVRLSQTALFTGSGAKNAGDAKPVAVSGISLGGADGGNYTSNSSATTTASITKKDLRLQGLTGVTADDRAYDGTRNVTVHVTSTGTVTANPADLVAGDVVTVFAPTSGTTTGLVANKSVGSARPVDVTGLALGGADAMNYSVSATSGVTVNITPRLLTASYVGASKVYDGSTAAAVAGTLASRVGGDDVGVAATGVFGSKDAAVGKTIAVSGGSLSGLDAGNYLLVNPSGFATSDITPKTIGFSYNGGSRDYNGLTDAVVNGSTSGVLAGDSVGLLASSAVFTGSGAKNAGTDKPVLVSGINLTGTDAGNYQLLTHATVTTASVTPRAITVGGLSGLTAVDRDYDGTLDVRIVGSGSGVPTSAGLVAGDDVSFVLPQNGFSAGTLLTKGVGNDKAVTLTGLGLGGLDAGNYRIAGTTGTTVNITPKLLTAIYTGVDKVYDGSTATSVTGTSAGFVLNDDIGIGGSAVFASKNAGSNQVVLVTGGLLSGSDAGNYTLHNPTGTTTASITPRLLSASFTGVDKVYDGSVAASVDGSLAGLVGGDSVGLGAAAVFTGSGARNVGSGKAVSVTGAGLTGADAANYALLSGATYSTTANVTPRPLNVAGVTGLAAADRVYDGTLGVQITGSADLSGASVQAVPGDDVAVRLPTGSITAGTMADKAVGTGKNVAVAGFTLAGTDAANYQIVGTIGLTVNIAPRPVVLLGIATVNRSYDGSTTVAINSAGGGISGVLAGDDLALQRTGVTGNMADKHAGSGKAVLVNGLSLAGPDAGNYAVVDTGLTVNITPRLLTAAFNVADKVYDGSTAATVASLQDDRVSGDAIGLVHGAASFAGKNAGNGVAVTLAGLTLTGADAGDYSLASNTATSMANILRRDAAVTADAMNKGYGDALQFTGREFTTSGLVAGETISRVGLASAGAAATANVAGGPYRVEVLGLGAVDSGFDASNYNLRYLPGLLTVAPRAVTVATNTVVRYADEPNPAVYGFSVGGGGLVGGDAIRSVVQADPANSANAAGGSVFALLPSGAVFASGVDSRNYALQYAPGLLVVLPKPPRLGDTPAGDGGGSGNVVFAVQVDEAELAATMRELERVAAPATPVASAPAATRPLPPPSAADIRVVLAGDSRSVDLPTLQRLPLISFDPRLARSRPIAPTVNTTAAP